MYSAEERKKLLQQLDEARCSLLEAVAGLSETQSDFKPSPNAWSIANIAEHLAIAEGFTIQRLEQMAGASNDGNFKEPDAVLFGKVTDRTTKFQAPERVQPSGKPLAASMERLDLNKERLAEFIRSSSTDTFRQHSMPHPVFGPLDGHQWLIAVAAHCTRHTRQIMETKSSPDFPKV
jgi:hypothetical protein